MEIMANEEFIESLKKLMVRRYSEEISMRIKRGIRLKRELKALAQKKGN
ncbi:MAG: hypothetical protein UU67_C0049G0004 [Candidatus Daviesbacteria bacterium GW2011_GWB1_41_5]|uniref:Uncharacterized protein n=1 Tax=Candidatus Daviesbacteria bacterium GW2011_GWB1_41_5 TaxID=1618429 RepID=A0A0G0WI49_9BACT|nr:MAG: hypothetical protein UU67_C0049G0004 [Candidatus Daviesbacteria bacterium GW2011_GWB1_41_5]